VAAITTDELIALQHKVDKAYRSNPKCGWAMNDDTVRYVRQLKDGQGRYILDPALQADGFDKILGKPVAVANDMATLATGNKTVVFGDFSKFIIRNVRNVVVRRMDEKYADADQVGFVAVVPRRLAARYGQHQGLRLREAGIDLRRFHAGEGLHRTAQARRSTEVHDGGSRLPQSLAL
jgi:hypothetical protein